MFEDRIDAAFQLVQRLKKYKDEDTVVVAIPRGGLPLGYVIAKELKAPLDIALSKKIGHPANKEFAVGSVSLHGRIIDRRSDVPDDYIESETKKLREQLKERYNLFSKGREPVDVENKVVIVVDDGIATGNTMLATMDMIRSENPEKIVVAIPVAPPRSARKLIEKAEEVICLATPGDFFAIGQYYRNFVQISDEEVVNFLDKANENLVHQK